MLGGNCSPCCQSDPCAICGSARAGWTADTQPISWRSDPNNSENIRNGLLYKTANAACPSGSHPKEITVRLALGNSVPSTIVTRCPDPNPFVCSSTAYITIDGVPRSSFNGDYVLQLGTAQENFAQLNNSWTVQNYETLTGCSEPSLPATGQANIVYRTSWRDCDNFKFCAPGSFAQFTFGSIRKNYIWNGSAFVSIPLITDILQAEDASGISPPRCPSELGVPRTLVRNTYSGISEAASVCLCSYATFVTLPTSVPPNPPSNVLYPHTVSIEVFVSPKAIAQTGFNADQLSTTQADVYIRVKLSYLWYKCGPQELFACGVWRGPVYYYDENRDVTITTSLPACSLSGLSASVPGFGGTLQIV